MVNSPYILTGAQESLYEKVNLKPCTMDLSLIMTLSDYQTIAASTEQLETIEECMSVWVKQIEQVCYSLVKYEYILVIKIVI